MVTPGTYLLDDPADWVDMLKFPDLSKYDFIELGKEAAKNYDPDKFNFYLMQDGLFERWLSLCDPSESLPISLKRPRPPRNPLSRWRTTRSRW